MDKAFLRCGKHNLLVVVYQRLRLWVLQRGAADSNKAITSWTQTKTTNQIMFPDLKLVIILYHDE
jgi:hypothetical protein